VCNRYRANFTRQNLEEQFQAWDDIEHHPRFNVAPTQPVVTIHQESGKRKIEMMRWGLIPSWASGIGAGNFNGHFNARSESITTTASFRDLVNTRHCLIPADGFYEWQQMGNVKQPYCFEVGAGELFAFAGLWDEWNNPSGGVIRSCTILTTTANALIGEVVDGKTKDRKIADRKIKDRMPVILPREQYDVWLRAESVKLDEVLRPYDAKAMRKYPVSTKLNNSKMEDPEFAKPIALHVPVQGQLF
jgi:putative SOS response-associated peptidase YedK